MLGLRKMIKSLIGESITTDQALDAIRNRYYVRIRYNDEQEAPHEGTRVIMPVAVGTTKKGYPVVRAFQTQGDTRRGAPKWKFFRLDRISAWTPYKNKQFTIAPDLYNYDGDRSMKTFIDNAKFDDREMSPLERTRAEFQTRMNARSQKLQEQTGRLVLHSSGRRTYTRHSLTAASMHSMPRTSTTQVERPTGSMTTYGQGQRQRGMHRQQKQVMMIMMSIILISSLMTTVILTLIEEVNR